MAHHAATGDVGELIKVKLVGVLIQVKKLQHAPAHFTVSRFSESTFKHLRGSAGAQGALNKISISKKGKEKKRRTKNKEKKMCHRKTDAPRGCSSTKLRGGSETQG
jgi:hypothetical protein